MDSIDYSKEQFNSLSLAAQFPQRQYSQHFEADIKMFGDKTTLTQIVLLLAYLRHHIQNKTPGEIKVSIGKHLETEFFNFTVNDEEIQQVRPEKEIEIN